MAKKHKKGWIISIIIGAVVAAAITVEAVIMINISGGRFRLDADDYGESVEVYIDDKEYTEMISQKRSFIVMVDKPGCVTTSDISDWLQKYPDEMKFKYYNLRWSYAKKTSLHDYVKFTPSIALIREGEVVAWLRADSDEDKSYYEDSEALKSWLKKYIIFWLQVV